MTTPFLRSPVEIIQHLYQLEFFRRGTQYLGTLICQQHEILDSYTTVSRNVDAWLDAEHHARFENVDPSRRRNPGRLVDLESDSVAKSVHELLPVAARGDHIARQGIYVCPCHTRPDAFLGGSLGIENELPH